MRKVKEGNTRISSFEIQPLRQRGVYSLELPPLDESVLQINHVAPAPVDIEGIWVNQVNNIQFVIS